MTILYALVARSKTVLVEYTSTSGNFPTVTRVLLGKIPDTPNAKMSYVYDQHVFHYIVEDKIIYMCMCDDMEKRRIPFGFLEDIKEKMLTGYGQKMKTAHAYSLNEEFGGTLQARMDFYNGPDADNFSQVNSKLDDVKNVMVQNIEMVLERGEKLELLVEKTEHLQNEAFKFQRSSRALKHQMWWQRLKLYLMIFAIFAIILLILLMAICNPDFKKCK